MEFELAHRTAFPQAYQMQLPLFSSLLLPIMEATRIAAVQISAATISLCILFHCFLFVTLVFCTSNICHPPNFEKPKLSPHEIGKRMKIHPPKMET